MELSSPQPSQSTELSYRKSTSRKGARTSQRRDASWLQVVASSIRNNQLIFGSSILLLIAMIGLTLGSLLLPLTVLLVTCVQLIWVRRRVSSHSLRSLRSKKSWSSLPTNTVRTAPASSLRAELFRHLHRVDFSDLKVGDQILCEAGEIIPADSVIVDGAALIDESALSGESAPVIRDTSVERRFLPEGARVLTNRVSIEISKLPQTGIKHKIRTHLEALARMRSQTEASATHWVLAVSILALVITAAVVLASSPGMRIVSFDVRLWLLTYSLCLLPLWFLPTLQRILGLATSDQLLHRNLLVRDLDIFESAEGVDTIFVPKSLIASEAEPYVIEEFQPAPLIELEDFVRTVQLAALCDESLKMRAIARYVKEHYAYPPLALPNKQVELLPTTAPSGLCGLHIFSDEGEDGIRSILLGAPALVRRHIERVGGRMPKDLELLATNLEQRRGSVLVVCDGAKVLGHIRFRSRSTAISPQEELSLVKPELHLERRLGIKVVVVDESEEQAQIHSPRQSFKTAKSRLDAVKAAQKAGAKVAYLAEGTSDLPALAQADLRLVTHLGSDGLEELAHVSSLNGERWRLRYLFSLARELGVRRLDLNAQTVGIVLANSLALMPMLGLSSAHTAQWQVNPLQLQSTVTAVIAVALVTVLNLALVLGAIVGVHDRRGWWFEVSTRMFGGPLKMLQLMSLMLVEIKLVDYCEGVISTWF